MNNNLKANIFQSRHVNENRSLKREMSLMPKTPAQAGERDHWVATETKSETLALQDQRPDSAFGEVWGSPPRVGGKKNEIMHRSNKNEEKASEFCFQYKSGAHYR